MPTASIKHIYNSRAIFIKHVFSGQSARANCLLVNYSSIVIVRELHLKLMEHTEINAIQTQSFHFASRHTYLYDMHIMNASIIVVI